MFCVHLVSAQASDPRSGVSSERVLNLNRSLISRLNVRCFPTGFSYAIDFRLWTSFSQSFRGDSLHASVLGSFARVFLFRLLLEYLLPRFSISTTPIGELPCCSFLSCAIDVHNIDQY